MGKRIRIHCIQHVPFEGPGIIADFLKGRGHEITSTHIYRGEKLPLIDDIDWLIVMGGPMGAGENEQFPWITEEIKFIKDAAGRGKTVLGICLGAQMIALALGAAVYKNQYREIGWFPLTLSPEISGTVFDGVFSDRVEIFHWHGDTFSLPEGAVLIGSTFACRNQGFLIDERIAALQFHLETTPSSAEALIQNCSDEMDDSVFVQTGEYILSDNGKFSAINQIMEKILIIFEHRLISRLSG